MLGSSVKSYAFQALSLIYEVNIYGERYSAVMFGRRLRRLRRHGRPLQSIF